MQGQKASKPHRGQTLAPLRLSQSYPLPSFPVRQLHFMYSLPFRSPFPVISLLYLSYFRWSAALRSIASFPDRVSLRMSCFMHTLLIVFLPCSGLFSFYFSRQGCRVRHLLRDPALSLTPIFSSHRISSPSSHPRSSRLIASRLRKQFLHPSVRSSSHASVFRPSGPVTDHRRRPCGG